MIESVLMEAHPTERIEISKPKSSKNAMALV